jgi:hypothetical protein
LEIKEMLFGNDFIETIENDPVKATIDICERAQAVVSQEQQWNDITYQAMAEAFA